MRPTSSSTRCSRSPRRGAELGCHEALFTLGEAPEDRYPGAARVARGTTATRSTVDYLVAACRAVLDETGLLPHANAGALDAGRAGAPPGGEPVAGDDDRDPRRPPGRARRPAPRRARQDPERAARHARGRGPGRGCRSPPASSSASARPARERLDALLAIAERARPSRPRAGGDRPELPAQAGHGDAPARRRAADDELLWTIAVGAPHARARRCTCRRRPTSPMPTASAASSPPASTTGAASRPLTPDHVNPERPWPALDLLRDATEAAGKTLAPRLTVYPEYVRDAEQWLDPDVRFAVRCASDLEGLARDDTWAARRRRGTRRRCSRRSHPAARRRSRRRGARRRARRRRGRASTRSSRCSARAGPSSLAVAAVADELRRDIVGDAVTFVRNRNINYTNVCTFKCRFCAFSKGPLSLNLRGNPVPARPRRDPAPRRRGGRVRRDRGLPAGRHPPRLRRRLLPRRRPGGEGGRARHPHPRLHRARGHRGRAPARHAARATTCSLAKEAGLATLPGTAAEILDDEVRAIICPDKIDTDEWLEAHRTAHSVGLRSNVTIMFGHVERPVHVARHLVRTRALQKETGGFTEFVPLPFVHMATPIFLQRQGPARARRSARRCSSTPSAASRTAAGSTTSRCRG